MNMLLVLVFVNPASASDPAQRSGPCSGCPPGQGKKLQGVTHHAKRRARSQHAENFNVFS
jgi:hypothetical protein